MNRELSEKIPVISFLMMLAVLMYHFESPDNALAVGDLDLKMNIAIDNFATGSISWLCMSWFFGITAFLLFRNLSFQNLGSKLKTRVKTLLVPYLLWQALFLIKSILQGNSWPLSDIIGKLFLLRIWPPLQAFWYIYAVFLLALLSPIFLLLYRSRRIGWFSALGLILLMYCLDYYGKLHIPGHHSYYLGNIKTHFPAYVIGSYCGFFYRDEDHRPILGGLTAFLLAGALLDGPFENDMLYRMTMAVLPMLILFLLPVADRLKNRTVYRSTFLIYATHLSLISLFREPILNFLYAVFHSASLTNLFGRILCILLIILINMGVRALMSRYTPRTLKLLTGGRC